jgi:surfeit locus 1 family protein
MQHAIPWVMFLLMEAVLISLGVWQLERRQWKEAVLADLTTASQRPAFVIASGKEVTSASLFRRVTISCKPDPRNSLTHQGFDAEARIASRLYLPCQLPDGTILLARTQWQRPGETGSTDARIISGRLYPVRRLSPLDRLAGPALDSADYWRSRLAKPPLPLLLNEGDALPPEPANNHLAYAVQWFLFAAVLGVIFTLHLRRQRLAPSPPAP